MSAYAKWYLLGGVVLTAVVLVLPTGVGRDAMYCLVAASAAVAIMIGVRLNRPAQPAAWYLVAAGMATWVLGGAIATGLPGAGLGERYSLVVDTCYLLTFPLVSGGVMTFARSRGRERRPTASLDSVILTVGVGLLSWVFLIVPNWTASAAPVPTKLVAAAYPLCNLVLFGAVVRLAKAPGAGRTFSRVVAALVGSMLTIQSLVQALGVAPTIEVASWQLDPRWLIAHVLAGTVALHPTMRALSSAAPPRSENLQAGDLVALAAALLVGPAILGGELLTGGPMHAGPVVIACTVLVLLVLIRMVRLVRYVQDQATTDDLTGLPNRRALYVQASAQLAQSQRRRQALLMLDLDQFKEVNDSLGHRTGDQLLIQVGIRLGQRLRSGDLLVRLGGDEFAILLEDANQVEAMRVAAALRAAFAEPFTLEDMSVHSGVSIGIALFPDHGSDLNTLLRKADIAMYQAKNSGDPHLYDGDDGVDRLRSAEEVRLAVADQQLVLHYQPKIDVVGGGVHGVEALVRWNHPTRGLVYPDDFLGLVEDLGLMRALSRIVLELALDQAQVWHGDGRPLTVAVNLSASSLVDLNLPDEVAAMLTERGLPPTALQLEITEELLMADRDRARNILTRLRERGIQISVDDFGTGYSSLAYLRDLPIDELKLDRSFVLPMSEDPRAAALVASTIALAHSLDLRMVAEGVENAAALAELARLGCDQVQGFYLSRPIPAAALDAWLLGRGASDGSYVAAAAV